MILRGAQVRFKNPARFGEGVFTAGASQKTAQNIFVHVYSKGWIDEDDLIMVEDKDGRTGTIMEPLVEFKPEPEQALRYNEGKMDWSLVHYKSMEPMIQVLMFGAKKYAPKNWMKGFTRESILNSAQRHMAALLDGQEDDPETKLSHAGHIMCNMMFYVYHYVTKKEVS